MTKIPLHAEKRNMHKPAASLERFGMAKISSVCSSESQCMCVLHSLIPRPTQTYIAALDFRPQSCDFRSGEVWG